MSPRPFPLPIIAQGVIRQGALCIVGLPRLAAKLGRIPDETAVELLIRLQEATRNTQQNRYWWGVVVEAISEHTGYTPEEVHDAMKAMFLPKTLTFSGNGVLHRDLVIGGTTTTLTVAEFARFIDLVREFAARDLNVSIPDAEPAGGV